MRFWGREIAGWLLVLLGVGIFYVCFEFLLQHHIVEAGVMTFIGVMVFRGGIHLLKVAVAARVASELKKERALAEPAKPSPVKNSTALKVERRVRIT